MIISSNPLPARKGEQGQWRRLTPGHLLIVRQGAVRAELGPEALADPDAANAPVPIAPPITGTRPPAQTHSAQAMAARPAGAPSSEPPPVFVPRARPLHVTTRAERRRYEVLHRTVYRYANPVERSAHVLRLFPRHDRLQTLHSCQVKVSVPGHERDFDDVFGNRVRRVLLETPFTELVIEARSDVELLDIEPLDFRPARVRSSLPLVWMPWQRQILQPFLLPPELPESELTELTGYAMSFARRNDFDCLGGDEQLQQLPPLLRAGGKNHARIVCRANAVLHAGNSIRSPCRRAS